MKTTAKHMFSMSTFTLLKHEVKVDNIHESNECLYIANAVPSCQNNHRGNCYKSQYKTGRSGMTASAKTI